MNLSDTKITLLPLIGLMNGRPSEEIEHFTISEILKHRCLRNNASKIEAMLSASSGAQDGSNVELTYVSALIAMHAQQTVVSTLIDILGYIPEIPQDTTH